MNFRIFGFVTAGIVAGFAAIAAYSAASGVITSVQATGMVFELIGMWGMPLICLAVNKARGKTAGGWTIFFTVWSWLAFALYDVAPFMGGFVHSWRLHYMT